MSEDPADIRNWLRLSDKLTTSGCLTPADPTRLAAIGTAHVINLAMEDHPEALDNAAQHMAAAGLAYSHIPVPFDAPELAHYDAFAAALENATRPVHVHCIMNWRVSAFLCRYHREHGMADTEALALMHRIWQPDREPYPQAEIWAAIALGEGTQWV